MSAKAGQALHNQPEEELDPMEQYRDNPAVHGGITAVRSEQTNKVLRNTYLLLSMTLLFGGAMAAVGMATGMPPLHWGITLIGYFGLLFLTHALANSAWGLAAVFALTGFMGLTLGPIISLYLRALPNGSEIVITALGGTGVIFMAMSAIALVSGKRFSGMAKSLMIGILVAFVAGIAAIVFEMPALSLAVSAMFVLLSAGLILYQTGEIVNGGETNYIMATVTLYVSLYNIFLSLLQLLGVMSDE